MAFDILAQDMAAQARRAAGVRLRPVPRVAFLGDSLTQFALNSGAGITQWTPASYLTWLRWTMRDRFHTEPALILGVASTRTDHLLATQVPQAIAARADIAFVQDGTNDVGLLTAAQSIANVAAAVRLLNAAGIAVVLIAIVPQGGWSTAKRQQAAAYNRQLWMLARDAARAVRFVDVNPAYTDYGTGNALAGYQFSDAVHDSPSGALAKAQLIAGAVDDLFPRAAELVISSSADAFDAALNPTGDMLANGLMAGTTGTLTSGATGTVPTGWTGGLAASGATTLTVALSKGADPGYATVPAAVMTLGGTGDANNAKYDQGIATPAGLAAGDRVYLQCDVRWSGLAGVKSVGPRLSVGDGSATYEAWDGAAFNPAGTAVLALPPAFAGLMRTPSLTLPANFQGLRARLQAVPVAGSAVAGTVAFGRCSLRRA